MVGSSKILTVSYGTFSCTLEGFDDSFGTMKAIAEYFRDLAADDRYFGAEPPVPDAQMLARIAEREVARRVEAQLVGTGVTLRTGDALPQSLATVMQTAAAPVEQPFAAQADAGGLESGPAVPAETGPAAAPRTRPVMRQVVTQSEPARAVQPAPPLMPPVVVAPIPPVQPMMSHQVAPPPRVTSSPASRPMDLSQAASAIQPQAAFSIPAHPDADSVAAKLQRIRAVVGRGVAPVQMPEYAEDLGETNALADDDGPSMPMSQMIHSLAESWNDLEDDADKSILPLDVATQSAAVEPDTTEAMANLGIAAVLAADAPATSIEVEVEVEVVQNAALELTSTLQEQVAEPAPVRARVIRVRRADFDTAAAAVPLAETQLSEMASALADSSSGATESFADLDVPSDEDGLNDLMALDGLDASTFPDSSGIVDPDAMLADDIDLADIPSDLTADLDLGDGTLPPDAEAALLQELAALERDALDADDLATTDGSDSGTGIDADAMDDVEPMSFSMDKVLAAAAKPGAGAKIDPDDVNALFDLPPGDDAVFDFSAMTDATPTPAGDDLTDDDMAPAEADLPPVRLGRDLLEREPEADAEAMERIMSQTDAELNSPENSRRREAIFQLKAAVAATEAARMLGEGPAQSEADDVETAFRDDLKQVVRPRRPVGEVSPDLRSERPRPAPLKLVASQRIDIPQPRPVPKSIMPVRPRRVSVQDDAGMATQVAPRLQAGSFAEFAASMGATQLPDLLEAAAAYTSFVEGVEDFSRPQLMKKVQDMAVEDFSREDGLRSFGTLLRQGRIMKTANGRFVVNEESRFNPERKSA